jgi:ADP-ribosylglycohydrolase
MFAKNRLDGMLLGAFVGDAMALGPHWIYDVNRIKAEFGEIHGITAPLPDSYHPNKHFGDFTHYGDLTLMLLEYMTDKDTFDLQSFQSHFQQFMAAYGGYKDHAMRETLDHLNRGVMEGSLSDELGGAARMAAPLYMYSDNEAKAVEMAVLQCSATHRDDDLLQIVRFLAEVTVGALSGIRPNASIERLLPLADERINEAYRSAQAVLHLEAEEAIPVLGQMCSSKNAFPSVIYLLLKYNLEFSATLFNNVQAGGDSAARGMVLGAILGAWIGRDRLPQEQLLNMKEYSKITQLMK